MSPRSKEQFGKMREKTREKIVSAALKLFAEKGYSSTSIDQVAAKAKVSKGAAYHYFESKEALLKAVIVQGLTEFESIIELNGSNASPQEQLEMLINVSFEVFHVNIRFWKLYFSLVTQMNLPKSIKNVLTPIIESLLEYVKNLMEQMGVADAEFESKIFGAIIDGIFVHYLMIGESYPLKEVQERILRKYINRK
jgi:AcrR family transcriptional regulator